MVEPVEPFECRELDGFEVLPRPAPMNDLALLSPSIVSARELSQLSPTLSTEGTIPANKSSPAVEINTTMHVLMYKRVALLIISYRIVTLIVTYLHV